MRISSGVIIFDQEIAEAVGVKEAVFTAYLKRRISEAVRLHQQEGTNCGELLVHEGQAWIPCTMWELSLELPFWTERQIWKIKNSCVSAGLIQTDRFNQDPRDRRLWYTVLLE